MIVLLLNVLQARGLARKVSIPLLLLLRLSLSSLLNRIPGWEGIELSLGLIEDVNAHHRYLYILTVSTFCLSLIPCPEKSLACYSEI